jgi:hypothetical protein
MASTKAFRCITVVLVLLVVTLLVTWPVLLHPKSMILGYSGDSTGTIYDIWAQRTYGLRIFGNHEVFWRGFPFGFTGNYSPGFANSLLTTLSFALSFALGEIPTYNLLIMVGIFSTGYFMYWACTKFGCQWYVALWGGVAFTMFPFHQLAAGGWITQVQLGPIPIALVWCHEFLNSPNWKKCGKVSLLLFISAITNAYVFLMVGVIVASTVVYGLPRLSKAWRDSSLHSQLFIASTTIIGTSCFAFSFQKLDLGVSRSNSELSVYGLRIRELLLPTELATILPKFIPRITTSMHHGSNWVEVSQFLGFFTIASASGGLLYFAKRKKTFRVFSWLLFLSLIFSWFGASQGLTVFSYDLPIPAQAINSVAPYWRVYSRFGVVIMAVFVLAACLFWNDVIGRVSKPWRSVIVIGMIGISLIELWSPLPGKTTSFTTPSYVEVIQTPDINSVVMYPVVPDGHSVAYDQVFWQRLHGKKLVNGGPVGTDSYDFQMAFSNLENPQLSRAFAEVGIDAVVVDKNAYRTVTGRKPIVTDSSLESIYDDDQYQVFRVMGRKDTLAIWPSGVQATEINSDGQTWRWTDNNFNIRYISSRPGCYEIRFSAPRAEGQAEIIFSKDGWVARRNSGYGLILRVYLGNESGAIQAQSESGLVQLPDGRQIAFFLSDILALRIADVCIDG